MPGVATHAQQREARARRARLARARAAEAAARGDQLGFDLEPPRLRAVPVQAVAAAPESPAQRAVPAAPFPGPEPSLPAPVPSLVRRPAPVLRDAAQTLDALLATTWAGLQAHGSVACPSCRGAMTPRYAAGPRPVGGRCRDCTATLA